VESSVCIRFVSYNTGGILSQSTDAWQPLCARYFSLVGWFCWPHSTRWMNHRTVPRVDTLLQSAGSCPSGSSWVWTRFWWYPIQLLGFRLWGTLSTSQKHSRASASWAVPGHWELPWGKSTSRRYKKPLETASNVIAGLVLTPIQQSHLIQSVYQSIRIKYIIVHRASIVDHLLTFIIQLKFGKISHLNWSGNRSLYPAWPWSVVRARLPGPSILSVLRALACTWSGTGVAAAQPPLPTRTHAFRNIIPFGVVAWAQDKGTHSASSK